MTSVCESQENQRWSKRGLPQKPQLSDSMDAKFPTLLVRAGIPFESFGCMSGSKAGGPPFSRGGVAEVISTEGCPHPFAVCAKGRAARTSIQNLKAAAWVRVSHPCKRRKGGAPFFVVVSPKRWATRPRLGGRETSANRSGARSWGQCERRVEPECNRRAA